jgi:hypothetical protein
MCKATVRATAGFLSVAALLLTVASARADDFAGKWTMNANGWTFVLDIKQDGERITGTMTGLNNDDNNTIEGKIKGSEITFTRSGGTQEYRGYLFMEDPTGKGGTKRGMAGIAKDERNHWGWYAAR